MLFCTFLFPFLHDCDVKVPNFSFYGGRKEATTKFYFSFCTWVWSQRIQLQEGSPKWVVIIAIKAERTQIHLLSYVFIAVALLNLKVPKLLTHRTRWQRKRRLKSEFAFFQSWLRLFQLTYFAKCRRTLLKLNSWGQYPSSEREIKFRRRLLRPL